MVRSFFLLLFTVVNLVSNATHIVGGDMTYQHISNLQYRVTLHLYIDCVNGNPGAVTSDLEANISYFDAKTYNLITNDSIDVLTRVNVQEVNYKCLKSQPNACVEQFTFSYIKEINPGRNGVIIAFQRCCRNYSITNILTPEDVGATFFIVVPPTDIVDQNSSATFKNLPPNFLCKDIPLVFDHSATDADGDSLVYSLMLPYVGADPMTPRPIPANKPPFASVIMSGSYNVANMMNGSVLLQINSNSGLLRVTPSQLGQYVFAVRVEEYRGGIKINEGFRDYQLNVIDCIIDVAANFTSQDSICKYDVLFQNHSIGDSLSYVWDFGESNTVLDVSTKQDGKWSYSNQGTYIIKLIASSVNCSDTFFREINIRDPKEIRALFDVNPKIGCDSLTVSLMDNSEHDCSYRWNMGDGTVQLQNSDIKKYTYQNPGSFIISLNIEDTNQCYKLIDSSLIVEVFPTKKNEVDFELTYNGGCLSDGEVGINTLKNNAGNYVWIISDGTVWQNRTEEVFTFSTKGHHMLTLRTEDTGRCVINDTSSVEIYIKSTKPPLESVKLYNVFTPNEDSFNNCFTIDLGNTDCVTLSFVIYNRWGELVFDSRDGMDCWNGKDNRSNKDLPEGEYFGIYKLSIEGQQEVYTLSNVISLLRN